MLTDSVKITQLPKF